MGAPACCASPPRLLQSLRRRPWLLSLAALQVAGQAVPDHLGLVQLGTEVSLAPEAPEAGVGRKQWALPSAVLPHLNLGQLSREDLSATASAQAAAAKADPDTLFSGVLGGLLAFFVLVSLVEFHNFRSLLIKCKSAEAEGSAREAAPEDSARLPGGAAAKPPPRRSLPVILALTAYRFYTGFMSATWLPYLLAMEGAELSRENQAMFMGIVKLLYGMSILLNPLFGLLGDRAARVNYGVGRRLFMRIGIITAGFGIYCCHFAAPRGLYKTFLMGIVIWRVGEGLNDVSSEAICPEMLPPEQYEMSSAIRASMFLVGGLMGYVMVALLAHLHYSWLYHGYLIMMLFCGCPALLVIDGEGVTQSRAGSTSQSLLRSTVDAYLKPARFEGGFPRACLCIFLFSCGTAPMFFILLMIRDLVGVEDAIPLQRHFSMVSIDFFLCAAVAAALNALAAPPKRRNAKGTAEPAELRAQSFHMTAASVIAFGVTCILLPGVRLIQGLSTRLRVFYVLAGFLGAAFGSVYSRFQDCNWQLLPPGVETANAMGYSTLWKLLGAGLGNFGAGLVLDLFVYNHTTAAIGHHASGTSSTTMIAYKFSGYLAMCLGSAAFVLVSAALVLTLPRLASSARSTDAHA